MKLKSKLWPRPIPRRLVAACAALLMFAACLVRAQNTNATAADTNAPTAATNAAAASPPADTGPKPDPSGTATGLSADAQSPSGTFVVSAPADLSEDDKKDAAK